MKVTLTGASGRLGAYACRTLVERGHVVRATDKVVGADLPGFRVYFAASTANTQFQPAAEVIRRHFADVPLRKPLDQIASLVDISVIEQETGWTPTIDDADPAIGRAAFREMS